jgi:hypothetical protein
MARRAATTLTALVLAACLTLPGAGPAPARADGDPASDILLGENVFYPYTPPVSAAIQRRLDAATAAAQRAHFHLKVALIASAIDLGTVPQLFGRPQEYADYLDVEISFTGPQPLLVVMADGYGVRDVGVAALRIFPTLPRPSGRSSDDLALAAVGAVARLAAAAGHPIPALARGGVAGAGGGGPDVALVGAIVLVAVLTAAGVMARRSAVRR